MRSFFTIPDQELIQETSVDPMGIQVIWTELGQKIFGDKLTTVSTDMRVFTINLFHHHLINSFFINYPEDIENARAQYAAWKTDYDIKAGLAIFLEDIYSNVMYQAGITDNSIETFGVLGIVKLRGKFNSGQDQNMRLEANKNGGILTRQIQLGMTGRYKGPMMKMEFFNRSLHYFPDTWDRVSVFLNKWEDSRILENHLIQLIRKFLLPSGKRDYPWLLFNDIKSRKIWNDIYLAYTTCFGSRKLRPEIRSFWKDRMSLTSGAPQALYEEVENYEPGPLNNCYTVFVNAARKLNNEPGEFDKVNTVIDTEPFLSHAEFLFRYMAQAKVKTLEEEEEALSKLREKILSTSDFSMQDFSNSRLSMLHKVMTAPGSLPEWIKGIVEFHRKIMNERGGTVWLDLNEQLKFKHHYAPELDNSIDTVDKYLEIQPWLHHYYLETLKAIRPILK